MTAPDPRLDEIQARAYAVASVVGNGDAMGPRFKDRAMQLTEDDVPFLLAELRKAHEALTRVEAITHEMDETAALRATNAEIKSYYGNRIRAAVAAAKGDGQEQPRNYIPAPKVPGWGELKTNGDGS